MKTLIRTELKTFRIEKKCETCDKGTMIATGFITEEIKFPEVTSEKFYKHVCNNPKCGAKEDLPVMYPTTETVPVPETEEKISGPAEEKRPVKKAAASKRGKK